MSFGEMLVLGVVALVVVGPRRLPSMLRSAGQVIGRVRRMAMEIRAESGIDEILDAEGIRSEIDQFRRMAAGQIPFDDEPAKRSTLPDREREYPRVGSDAYGALSEDLVPYVPAPLAPELAAAPTAAIPTTIGGAPLDLDAALPARTDDLAASSALPTAVPSALPGTELSGATAGSAEHVVSSPASTDVKN